MPAGLDTRGASVSSPAEVRQLAELLRVLSDENRLQIVALLAQRESCVCEIMSVLSLGQSLVSHHLGVLRRAGLVQDRRDGHWVYYSIDPEGLKKLNALLSNVIDVNGLPPAARWGANQNPSCFVPR